jgi:hypothetical protein
MDDSFNRLRQGESPALRPGPRTVARPSRRIKVVLRFIPRRRVPLVVLLVLLLGAGVVAQSAHRSAAEIGRVARAISLSRGHASQPESPRGEIYRYRVAAPSGYSATDLETIQDWILERRFRAIPGVAAVDRSDGQIYEVAVDLDRLTGAGLTLPQLLAVLDQGALDRDGQSVSLGPQLAVIRGVGLVHSAEDIRTILLTAPDGSFVPVKEVATVSVDTAAPPAIDRHGGDAIVQGVIFMNRGADRAAALKLVEAEIDRINGSSVLPPGIRIEKLGDGADLRREIARSSGIADLLLVFAVAGGLLAVVAAAPPHAVRRRAVILSWTALVFVLAALGAGTLAFGSPPEQPRGTQSLEFRHPPLLHLARRAAQD